MIRYITENLKTWKESNNRKPLIVKGAKGVGKTYILKQFGKENYREVVYFNFSINEDLDYIFSMTQDLNEIINNLEIIGGKKIDVNNTLIIFDDIHTSVSALNMLKEFYLKKPEMHIICAGSLFSNLSKISNYVKQITLEPMNFSEFLIADGYIDYVEYMKNLYEISPIANMMYDAISEKLKTYFMVGGMPNVVNTWIETKNVQKVKEEQDKILNIYSKEFAKYGEEKEKKLFELWNNVPGQLLKTNKRFLYQLIKGGTRSEDYEEILDILCNMNLLHKVYKVYNVTDRTFPLKAYNDLNSFKVYLNDIGLLKRMYKIESRTINRKNKLFEDAYGVLAENYVFCVLNSKFKNATNYYSFNSTSN
jgi:hypothetical protein